MRMLLRPPASWTVRRDPTRVRLYSDASASKPASFAPFSVLPYFRANAQEWSFPYSTVRARCPDHHARNPETFPSQAVYSQNAAGERVARGTVLLAFDEGRLT